MSLPASLSDPSLPRPSMEPDPTDLIPAEVRDSPTHRFLMKRFAEKRDARVIVSGDNSGTGLGKTTAATVICILHDIWGWSADKATLDPREYSVEYDAVRPGSWLMLDEAEKSLDRRRSMSKEVLEIGHDFATKRYRQVFGILTLPSKDMMDARIADKLCDLWILVREKGKADVFKLDENAFTGKVYYHKIEEWEWPNLDDDPRFQELEQKKHKRLTGETKSKYVHRDEVEELKDNYWNKAEARTTYDFIKAAYQVAKDDDSPVNIRQSDLGQITGMSQSNVSKIVNTDEFTDFYKSFRNSAEA